jgi:non-homologous end joining protein Ku
MGVIEAKVAGQKPEPARKTEPTKIGDLMAALEASVAAAREGRREPEADEAKPKKAARKPRAASGGSRRKQASEEAPARRRKTA